MRSMTSSSALSRSAAGSGAPPGPDLGTCGSAPPGLVGVDPVVGPLCSALAVKEVDGDRSPRLDPTLAALLLKLAVARDAASSSPVLSATRSVVYVWTV